MHQLFSVVTEWCRGCFCETSPGGRCGAMLSLFDQQIMLKVPAPLHEISVGAFFQNFGNIEVLERVSCGCCKQTGQSVRRQYLSRVGPLLLLQLAIYDVSTQRKFGRDVRILADERVSVRVEGRVCDYDLVAAVEHLGDDSMRNGHYVCYRRREDGSWLVLNDDGYGPSNEPRHGSVMRSEDFQERQMYLCMYARRGTGVAFGAAERPGEVGDVFAGFGAAGVVDVETVDARVDDDLMARVMQLSLETAGQENEDRDIALAIERSKEDFGVVSGTCVASSVSSSSADQFESETRTSASSSSVDQFESQRMSGEGRTGRPLRRWDGNVDTSVFDKIRTLRRHDAMIGMDEDRLSKNFRRLGLGDQCALESIAEDGEESGCNVDLEIVTGDQGSVVRREGVASGTFVSSPVAVGSGESSVAVGRAEFGTPVPSSAVDEGIENMSEVDLGALD